MLSNQRQFTPNQPQLISQKPSFRIIQMPYVAYYHQIYSKYQNTAQMLMKIIKSKPEQSLKNSLIQ